MRFLPRMKAEILWMSTRNLLVHFVSLFHHFIRGCIRLRDASMRGPLLIP
jgi:hypothetical protein